MNEFRRKRSRTALLVATLTLAASALTAIAPTAAATEAPPMALGTQELVFRSTVDASAVAYPVVARKAFRAEASGKHVFKLKWAGDAHLKLFIYDGDGDLVARKGNDTQPKRLAVNLTAGEKYKIKVKAASGTATFKVFVRAPEFDVGAYFDGMPGWDEIHPYLPPDDDSFGWSEWEEDPTDPSRECRYEHHDLQNSAEEIVTFGGGNTWLYPGVLLQGDGHAGGILTVKQLPIHQREPVTLFVDFLDGDITRAVADPTPGNLAEAIGDVIEQAVAGGYSPATNVVYRETQTHNAEQMALSLGLSVSYMKSGIQSKLDMSRSTTENTLTVYFKETAFTAAMADQPQTPGEFFSDDLTEALLQKQIDLGRLDDEANVPVYVDSVTYGRILIYSITSTESLTDIEAAVSGVYNSGLWDVSAEALASYQELLSSAETKLVTIGGSSTAAAAAIRTGDFTEYFGEDPLLTEYRPISYVMKDLQGSVAYLGETTEYDVRECRPVPEQVVRITFDKALLVSFDDGPGDSGYELDRFLLETWAYNKKDANDPGTPVFAPRDPCPEGDADADPWWPPPTEVGIKWIVCWGANEPYQTLSADDWWQPNEAQHGLWYRDIPFDDTGEAGYLEFAAIQLRAGFEDWDSGANPNDWSMARAGTLQGSAMWEDYWPEDDSTYRFPVSDNGATWQVYVTIELVPAD